MYNELCTLPKTGITPLTPFWESKAFFVQHFSHYIIVYFIHDIWVYYIIAKKVLAWSSFVQDSWLLILISSSIVAFNLHISHVRMAPADMLWQIWHVQIYFFLAGESQGSVCGRDTAWCCHPQVRSLGHWVHSAWMMVNWRHLRLW